MIDIEVEDDAWTKALPGLEDQVTKTAEAVIACAPWDGGRDVVILLTGDTAVRDLNLRFLGKDKPTNVLSFPGPAGAAGHLGDIALAYGVCAAEAAEQGKPLAHHLQHLVAHGVLHLIGYDHQSDAEAEVMEDLERRVLAGLGIPDPYLTDDAPG